MTLEIIVSDIRKNKELKIVIIRTIKEVVIVSFLSGQVTFDISLRTSRTNCAAENFDITGNSLD